MYVYIDYTLLVAKNLFNNEYYCHSLKIILMYSLILKDIV